MGRKRKSDKHLPQRVYLRRGTYFFVDQDGSWKNLGRELGGALVAYARIVAPVSSATTMSQIFDRYVVEVIPRLAPRTQSDYLKYLKKLRLVFDPAPPNAVTAAHISDYHLKRAERSVVQANREKACLSAVFTSAVQWHYCESNPCREVPRLPEPPRRRYVTDAEFSALYRIAPQMMRFAMDLAIMTGQREGDLLRLSRSQLTQDGILFSIGKSKRRHARFEATVEQSKQVLVEWSDELRELIDSLKLVKPQFRTTLLCTRAGRQFTSDGFRSNWHRLMVRALASGKLAEPFTFHDLRAKSASDDSVEIATERLGHDDSRTTQRIYRRKPRRARAAAKILDTA